MKEFFIVCRHHGYCKRIEFSRDVMAFLGTRHIKIIRTLNRIFIVACEQSDAAAKEICVTGNYPGCVHIGRLVSEGKFPAELLTNKRIQVTPGKVNGSRAIYFNYR